MAYQILDDEDDDELFCGMIDQRKAFSLISSWDNCQRSSPSRIFDMPRAGVEPAQNLSSGFIEWSCAIVMTTTPHHHIVHDFRLNATKIRLWYTHIQPFLCKSEMISIRPRKVDYLFCVSACFPKISTHLTDLSIF